MECSSRPVRKACGIWSASCEAIRPPFLRLRMVDRTYNKPGTSAIGEGGHALTGVEFQRSYPLSRNQARPASLDSQLLWGDDVLETQPLRSEKKQREAKK